MSELPGRLTALGLRHVADNLDDLVALAAAVQLEFFAERWEMRRHLI